MSSIITQFSYWQFSGDQKEWTIMRGKKMYMGMMEKGCSILICHLFLILQRQNIISKAPWMCCSQIFPRLNWVLVNNSTQLVVNVVIFKIFSFGLYIVSSVIVLPFEVLFEVHFWNSAVVSLSFAWILLLNLLHFITILNSGKERSHTTVNLMSREL